MNKNILYIGKCEDVLKKIEDNSIDCIITSPPYDDLRDYNGYSFDIKSISKELYRVLKKGGIIVWVVGDKTKDGGESCSSFKQALEFVDKGFLLYDTMIYAKNNPIPLNHRRYEQVFEYMFIFSKGKPKTFNPITIDCLTNGSSGNFRQRKDGILEAAHKKAKTKKTKIKGNIWYYSVGNNKSTKDAIAFKHPATFPEELVIDHLNSWTNKGDIILDPFCGSGTTCKVSYLNERNFIGIDISEEYIRNISAIRLKELGWKENIEIIKENDEINKIPDGKIS